MVRYPAERASKLKNVVPQNEPILTNIYWMLNTEFSVDSSAFGKRPPLIPETFPLKKPVPIEIKMIIAQIIPMLLDFQAHKYPSPIKISPKGTKILGLTQRSAI